MSGTETTILFDNVCTIVCVLIGICCEDNVTELITGGVDVTSLVVKLLPTIGGISILDFLIFSGSIFVLKLVASVIVGCTVLIGVCNVVDEPTIIVPLASELIELFELSFAGITVGVLAPVFLFLLV